tara:strand:+ start:208 stop:765 length:558 start_codon:yes stop_codon:yes gene_type:complete
MAPKRGDTKTQNGVTYRYGYKNGKLQWIRSHTKFNPRIGDKLKSTWKGAKNLGSNVSRKVFGNPKTNANKKYQSETWTKKPNNKMATWRVDDKENKKLQEEHKSGSDHTYQRVTSKNKKDLSNQQVDKPSDKKSSGKKMHSIEKKNREIHGDEAIDKLKAKHAKWKADRKKAREDRRKKRLKSKK